VRRIRIAASLASALLWLSACGLAWADGAHHSLWQVKGRENTVYLLGSVHVLPATEHLPVELINAYKDAGTVVMEIDMDDLDPAAAQEATLRLGMLPEGETLEQRLGAPTYARVAARTKDLGLDPDRMAHFQPWLAAITLTQLQLMKLGMDPNAGVEKQLVPLAQADHKEIRGLETLEEQLGMLANLPAERQKQFVLYSLEDSDDLPKELDTMLNAWRAGDAKALAAVLENEFKQFPDLYKPLTVDRNRRWVPQLEKMLTEKSNYLVVVGALHLVGHDSVIDMLEQRGYKVVQQ
jgi:uncharacterized protein YbaP (TraB family)